MYRILYHPLVLKEDFHKIPKGFHKKLLRGIEKKLLTSPEIFGKPLLGKLHGYYRLRIDPYRVIYRIEKNKVIVYVLHIGLRKDLLVYLEAAKRLKLI